MLTCYFLTAYLKFFTKSPKICTIGLEKSLKSPQTVLEFQWQPWPRHCYIKITGNLLALWSYLQSTVSITKQLISSVENALQRGTLLQAVAKFWSAAHNTSFVWLPRWAPMCKMRSTGSLKWLCLCHMTTCEWKQPYIWLSLQSSGIYINWQKGMGMQLVWGAIWQC